MANKELAPILVYEDKLSIKRDLNYLDTRILPHCPAIQKAFESLELAEISNEYLNDMLFGSCTRIEIELEAKISLEIDNKFLREEALKRARASVLMLIKTVDKLLEKCVNKDVSILLHCLSISNNGNIVFSAESKEELKAAYREYICTEKGIARRKLHESAAKVLNQFRIEMGGNIDVIELFDISLEDDSVIPVPCIYE